MSEERELNLNDLFVSEANVRIEVGDISDLVRSIKEEGLINAIIVRRVGERYEIVTGRRRFEACKALGYTTIRAKVRELDDVEACKISLEENEARREISPEERGKAYLYLKERVGTNSAVASRLGIPVSRVRAALDVLEAAKKLKPSGVVIEPRRIEIKPEEVPGRVSISPKKALTLQRAFRATSIQRALTEEERKQKMTEMAKHTKDLSVKEVRKVTKRLKRKPEEPVPELVKRALEEPEPMVVASYFRPPSAEALTKVAQDKGMSVGKFVVMVVENWLVNAGYKIV